MEKIKPRYESDRLVQVSVPLLLRIAGQSWCVYAEPNSKLFDVEIQGTIYVGFSSIMLSGLVRSYVEIGRYCNIGRKVIIGTDSFRNEEFSGSLFFNFTIARNSDIMVNLKPKRRVIIGNDCCIGDGAVIESGVTIGHGAIIKPNSFIDRDVSPYEIVAGNGATVGYRFDAEMRTRLLGLNWWNKDPNVLKTLVGSSPKEAFNALSGYTECLDFPLSYHQFKNT